MSAIEAFKASMVHPGSPQQPPTDLRTQMSRPACQFSHPLPYHNRNLAH